MKIVQEYTKISTQWKLISISISTFSKKNSIKASKTELLNKSNSRSPCFTASSSQITLMSSLWQYISMLYNCHASLRLTPPTSRKGTLKSTLYKTATKNLVMTYDPLTLNTYNVSSGIWANPAKWISPGPIHHIGPNLWYTIDGALLGRLGNYRSCVKKGTEVAIG